MVWWKNIFSKNRKARKSQPRELRSRLARQCSLESLEDRHVMTQYVFVYNSTLYVYDHDSNYNASLAITSQGNNVVVTDWGSVISNSISKNSFNSIYVQGYGGNDSINLAGVSPSSFPYIYNAPTIYGGPGNDSIIGSSFADVIYGNDGDDMLAGNESTDYLYGGAGNDTLYGGVGNGLDNSVDQLFGEAGNDILVGEGGADFLSGGIDDDFLHGGAGNDQLVEEAGNDRFYFAGSTSLGTDTITNPYGTQGGTDWLDFSGITGYGVSIDLASTSTQTIASILSLTISAGTDVLENVQGTALADTIKGNSLINELLGGAGNDTIYGRSGNDILRGGDGIDTLYGEAGNDALYGDAGDDTLDGGADDDSLYGGDGADSLLGGTGTTTYNGGAGDDRFENDWTPQLSITGNSSVAHQTLYSATFTSLTPNVTGWVIDWGDGSATESFSGLAATLSHTYTAVHSGRTITATATDEDGSYSVTKTVAITNAFATLTASGDSSVNEGASYALSVEAVDPDGDTITNWEVDWGDGTIVSYSEATMSLSKTHVYADGYALRTIKVRVTDDEENTSPWTTVKTVTVNNLWPTIVLSHATNEVLEGEAFVVSLTKTNFGDDTISSISIDWGDGTAIEEFAANTTTATHYYADGYSGQSFNVTARQTDEDGNSPWSSALNVLVHDKAPTATITGDDEVVAGTLYTLNLSYADVAADPVVGWEIDWGDGLGVQSITGDTPSVSHTYPNGDQEYSIKARVKTQGNSSSSSSPEYTFSAWSNSIDVAVEGDESNSSPTTTGISNISWLQGGEAPVVDLHSAFADAEDSDQALIYTIVGNSDAALIDNPFIVQGKLYFGHDGTKIGTSELTIRATDRLGQYVETSFEASVLLGYDATYNSTTKTLAVTPANGNLRLDFSVANGYLLINGLDQLFVNGSLTSQQISVSTLTQLTVSGTAESDELDLSAINATSFPALTTVSISGGAGDDLIRGSQLNDTISGDDGHDILYGNGGIDSISGNAGDDLLIGGQGLDTLDGGAGTNELYQEDIDAPAIAPRLPTPAQQFLALNETLELELLAINPSGQLQDIVYGLSEGAPEGVSLVQDSLNPEVAVLTWEPDSELPVGRYQIGIDVWDENEPELRTRTYITISYGAENLAPVIESSATITGYAGERLTVQVQASDPDGAYYQLRYALAAGSPAGVTINSLTGVLSWTPTGLQVDSHTITVKVTDSGNPARETTQDYEFNILAANEAPTISGPASVTLDEDDSFEFVSTNVLTVGDADGGSAEMELAIVVARGVVTLASTSGLEFIVGSSAPTQRLIIRGTPTALNAALNGLLYEPQANHYGADEIRLELNDLGNGGSHRAITTAKSIAVSVAQVVDAPGVADQDFYIAVSGSALAAAGQVVVDDHDPNQILTYEITAGNSSNNFLIDAVSGRITVIDPSLLTADDEYELTIRAAYRASPLLYSDATITLHAVASAAELNDLDYTVDADDVVTGNLLTTALGVSSSSWTLLQITDAVNSHGQRLEFGQPIRLPSGATLTLARDGSFSYDASTSGEYQALYSGTVDDSFSVKIYDGAGNLVTKTVRLTVTAINELHTVVDQSFSLAATASTYDVVGKLLVQHSEAQQYLYYAIDSGTDAALFNISGSGVLTYVGTDPLVAEAELTFVVSVTDSASNVVFANVTVVFQSNSLPVVPSQNYRVAEDLQVAGNFLTDNTVNGSAQDADLGQTLSIVTLNGVAVVLGQPTVLASGATLTIASDGSFVYDASTSSEFDRLTAGSSAYEVLRIGVRDSAGGLTEANLVIQVLGRNDLPEAANLLLSVASHQTYSGNLLSLAGTNATRENDVTVSHAQSTTIVAAGTTVTTERGGSVTIKPDGSFVYSPAAVTGVLAAEVGAVLDDSFLYKITDAAGKVSEGVVRFSIPVTQEVTKLEVLDFGLDNDTGSSAQDKKTQDATIRGTLSGSLLGVADHFVIEFVFDLADYAQTITTADESITLDELSSGYPNFSFDPTTSLAFANTPEQKILAYRVIARDALDDELASTDWKFFSFELTEAIDIGDLRLADPIELYYDNDTNSNNNSAADYSDKYTSDPRLTGAVHGDFDSATIRVAFSYERDSVTYNSHVDLTAAGSFVFDPTALDLGLRELTYNTTLTISYEVGILDGSSLQTPLIGEGTFVFTYVPVPAATSYFTAFDEADGQSLQTASNARVLAGTVYSNLTGSVFVEFDYSDINGEFDGIANAEVMINRNVEQNDNTLDFQYTVTGLVGATPGVRARVREWNSEHGAFVYGSWLGTASTLSTLTAPNIDSFTHANSSATNELPVLKGNLHGAPTESTPGTSDLGKLANITIELFYSDTTPDTNAVPDAIVTTDSRGYFQFTSRNNETGYNYVYARSAIGVPGSATRLYGDWRSVSYYIATPDLPDFGSPALEVVDAEPEQYQYVNSHYAWVVSEPVITGKLTQTNNAGVGVSAVQIEFAHDNLGESGDEETVVYRVTPDYEGEFNYQPFFAENGDYTLRARLVYYDALLRTTFTGSWQDLGLHITGVENDDATIENLTLVNATEDEEEVLHTIQPVIRGKVVDPENYAGFVTIEFRNHATETVIGSTVTDASGNFSHELTGLSAGEYTVDVRVIEWDYRLGQFVYGPWTDGDDSLAFVLDEAVPVSIDSLELLNDTGSSSTDDVTANATLKGQLIGDEILANRLIAIDIDDDDTIDAMVTTNAQGTFYYTPSGLTFGTHTVVASLATWDAVTAAYVYSSPISLEFTYEYQGEIAATIVDLALKFPPEVSEPATNSTIVGRVLDVGDYAGVTIDIDLDSNDLNGISDSVNVDGQGNFEYDPDFAETDTYTIRVRTRKLINSGTATLLGDWETITFDYEHTEETGPSITAFGPTTITVAGTPPTSNSRTVSGTVGDTSTTENLTVEFSLTENGPVIGYTRTFSGNNFSFELTSLAPAETHTIWVRVKQSLPGYQPTYSESVSTTFIFEPDVLTGIRIGDLGLANDTATVSGSTNSDGSTEDAEINGAVQGVEEFEDVVVQVDLDHDGNADATIEVDAEGQFTYTPSVTTPGFYEVRFRAVSSIAGYSSWQTLNFVYDTNDSSAQALALVDAFATIATDWQQTTDFAELFGEEAEDTIYETLSNQAGADYDFATAQAELDRRAAQAQADNDYQVAKRAAEAAYRAELATAQAAFAAALALLPESQRATYTLKDFAWPTAPTANSSDTTSDLPTPPSLAVATGPQFDVDQSYSYRLIVAAQESLYQIAVNNAHVAYNDALDDAEEVYQGDLRAAESDYREDLQAAQDALDDALAEEPEEAEDNSDALHEQIQQAWKDYYKALENNNQIFEDAQDEAEAIFGDKAAGINAAWDDEFHSVPDDECEHEVWYGEEFLGTETVYHPVQEDDVRKYNITKAYSAQYEAALNTRSQSIFNAQLERDRANAQALRDALNTIHTAERELATIGRDQQNELSNDRSQKYLDYYAAVSAAQADYAAALATAQMHKAKSIADAAYDREDSIVDAQQTLSEEKANARVTATEIWATAVNTPWADYQTALADAQRDYEITSAGYAHTRDESYNTAAKTYGYTLAEQTETKEINRAEAVQVRTDDLNNALHSYQIDVSAKNLTRDEALADLWTERLESIADAEKQRSIDTAELTAKTAIREAAADHKIDLAIAPHWHGTQGFARIWATDAFNYECVDGTQNKTLAIHNDPLDFHEAYQYSTAEIDRDESIGIAELNFKYATAVIDANSAYGKDSNTKNAETSKEISSLLYDYQLEVAGAEDTYVTSLLEGEIEFAKKIAEAEALQFYTQAKADADYAYDDGVGSNLLSEIQTNIDQNFQEDVAEQYDTDITTVTSGWGSNVPTAWKTYHTDLAASYLQYVRAIKAASNVLAETNKDNANDYQSALYDASIDYAEAEYGEEGQNSESEHGAYYGRTLTIVAAYEENNSTGGHVTFAEAHDGAILAHDEQVADAGLTYHNALIDADVNYSKAIAEADRDLAKKYAESQFAHAVPGGISWEAKIERDTEAADLRDDHGIDLNKDRVIKYAEAHTTWVSAVGTANVTLVEGLTNALKAQALDVYNDRVHLAEEVSGAEVTYQTALADAGQDYDLAMADADRLSSIATAVANAVYANAADLASRAAASRETEANKDKEIGLANKNATDKDDAYSASPNALSLYEKSLADAELARVTARENAQVHLQTQTNLKAAQRTATQISLSLGKATRDANAAYFSAVEDAGYSRQWSIDIAMADGELYVAVETAEATLEKAAVDLQAPSDVEEARAIRDRDNAYAQAALTWVKTVAAADADEAKENITESARNEIEEQADDTREEANERADEAYETALDDAGVNLVQAFGEARITYVTDVYTARLTHVTDTSSADASYDQKSAESSQAYIVATANSQANYDRDIGRSDANFAYQTSLLGLQLLQTQQNAEVAYATATATAEADYQVSIAEADATNMQTQSSADLNNSYLRFKAAEAASYAAWLSAMSVPYTTYMTALAQSNATATIAAAELNANINNAIANATRQYTESQIELNRESTIRESELYSQSLLISGAHSANVDIAVAQANLTQALAWVNADVTYDIAVDAIERQHHDNSESGVDDSEGSSGEPDEDYAQELRDATYNLAEAQAGADQVWQDTLALADLNYTIAEARREANLTVALAALTAMVSASDASAEHDKNLLVADLEKQRTLGQADVENANRMRQAVSYVSYQDSFYALKSTAIQESLAGAMPVADGQIHGITAGFADGDLTVLPNKWAGSANAGEFTITGTTLTLHASAGGGTISLGTLGSGIAVDDAATGTGYVMYSAANVFTRYSAHAPATGNSEHLIAVRYNAGQWQYNDDTAWRDFTPVSTDLLIAELDFDADMIGSLGGMLGWAESQTFLASAENAAWQTVREYYLDWQADVSVVYSDFVSTAANAKHAADYDLADAGKDLKTDWADAVQSQANAAAGIELLFQQQHAQRVYDYRVEVSAANHDFEIMVAIAERDEESNESAVEVRDDRIGNAEEHYEETTKSLERHRIDDLARSGQTLGNTTSDLQQEYNIYYAERQDALNDVIDNTNYKPGIEIGYEESLIASELNYIQLRESALNSQLDSMATSSTNVHFQFLVDSFQIRKEQLNQPLGIASEVRDIAIALANFEFSGAASAAELAHSTAQSEAAGQLGWLNAAKLLAQAQAQSAAASAIPVELISTPDSIVSSSGSPSDYAVSNPASPDKSWYNGTENTLGGWSSGPGNKWYNNGTGWNWFPENANYRWNQDHLTGNQEPTPGYSNVPIANPNAQQAKPEILSDRLQEQQASAKVNADKVTKAEVPANQASGYVVTDPKLMAEAANFAKLTPDEMQELIKTGATRSPTTKDEYLNKNFIVHIGIANDRLAIQLYKYNGGGNTARGGVKIAPFWELVRSSGQGPFNEEFSAEEKLKAVEALLNNKIFIDNIVTSYIDGIIAARTIGWTETYINVARFFPFSGTVINFQEGENLRGGISAAGDVLIVGGMAFKIVGYFSKATTIVTRVEKGALIIEKAARVHGYVEGIYDVGKGGLDVIKSQGADGKVQLSAGFIRIILYRLAKRSPPPAVKAAPAKVTFSNQMPLFLEEELKTAAEVGAKALRVGDKGFKAAANEGVLKFVVTESGELLVSRHTIKGVEISHAFIAKGGKVLAAGQVDIAVNGGEFIGIAITNHSGHYMPSLESLKIARVAFEKFGITFP